MLAFASYGMVLGAPAHAHSSDNDHGRALHVIAMDLEVSHLDQHHDDRHETADDHETGDTGGDPTDSGFHVHGVVSFTTVDERLQISQPATITLMHWTHVSDVSVSGLFSPFKKPPRTFL